MSPRHKLLLALPIAALAIAGCGGGGDDSTTTTAATTEATTTALSKAELIEQGDAICAEVNAAVGTVGASSAETGSPAAQVADLYSGMVSSLKNLGGALLVPGSGRGIRLQRMWRRPQRPGDKRDARIQRSGIRCRSRTGRTGSRRTRS